MTGTQRIDVDTQRRSLAAALTKALQRWQIPPLPRRLRAKAAKRRHDRELWSSLARRVRSRLSEATARQVKAELELCAADWLCETIRLNIKRGRLFELNRVLRESQADCFGYALLFHRISRRLGLKTGIVEVLIDNAGRMVPHMANVVSLSDRRTRFVDLWYGSKNIHHQRLALMIRQRGRWSVVDIDWRQLTSFAQVKGLPPRCIEAIEKYMMANRHLERGIRLSSKSELRRAVRLYTDAIARYPENARLYFNRAVAYENLGDKEAAQADYGAALHDEDSLIRVQARQHDEVVRLIGLDQIGASTREQEIYLLRKGFITGKEIPPERIAARYRLPVDGIDEIVSRVEARILSLPLTPVYP